MMPCTVPNLIIATHGMAAPKICCGQIPATDPGLYYRPVLTASAGATSVPQRRSPLTSTAFSCPVHLLS